MQLTTSLLSAAAYAIFAVTSVVLIVQDVRLRRLPNLIIGWGTVAPFAMLVCAAALSGAWSRLAVACATAAAYGAVMLLLWLAAPAALGAGDVKLAPLLGLMTAWVSMTAASIWMPVALALLSGAAGVIQLLRRRKDLPFGPVMIVASWCAIGLGYVLPSLSLA